MMASEEYRENRKSYESSQLELYSISDMTSDMSLTDGENDAYFWLYLVPKLKESWLKLPTLPKDPDADGARWILEKTGTGPEAWAEMTRILEQKLKQPQEAANWVACLEEPVSTLDDKLIYLSGLIVQDRSLKVKGLMRSGSSERGLEQLMKDPTLADCLGADGLSCMEVAAKSGSLEVLSALLEQDPQRINRKTDDAQNLLHHAALRWHPYVDLIQFLCSYGEGRLAKQRNYWDNTPLQIALNQGVLEHVECLLPYTKGHLGISDDGKGTAATCTAIYSQQGFSNERLCYILKLLLESVPVNLQDLRGCTALHWAAHKETQGAWELLLRDYGADPNIRDFHGSTPIALACEHLPVKCLEVLEKERKPIIDWWSIDADGSNPLAIAQEMNKDPEVARFVASKTIESNALQALEFFRDDHDVCADIHTFLKNYDAAIERLEQAGPYASWKSKAQILQKIARIRMETNAPEAAEALLEPLLATYHMQNDPLMRDNEDRRYVAHLHTTLARALMMQNKFLDALKSIEVALDIETRDHGKAILLDLQYQAKLRLEAQEPSDASLASRFADMSCVR